MLWDHSTCTQCHGHFGPNGDGNELQDPELVWYCTSCNCRDMSDKDDCDSGKAITLILGYSFFLKDRIFWFNTQKYFWIHNVSWLIKSWCIEVTDFQEIGCDYWIFVLSITEKNKREVVSNKISLYETHKWTCWVLFGIYSNSDSFSMWSEKTDLSQLFCGI